MEKNSIEILIIGGSAGSLEVLLQLLPDLKSDISFPIVIVLHRKSSFDSSLADLLKSRTHLQVKEAEEKESLEPGTIYIAPADYHLLIEKDRTFSMDFSERIHYSRPAIDATFQTASEAFGNHTAGLLLSGANSDGSIGLKTINERGGLVAIQNPETSEVSYMPSQALLITEIKHIIDNDMLASFINSL